MVVIEDFEMPSNCYMCDLHNYHECDLTGESIEEDYCWNGDSREKHCPLREVEAIPKDQYKANLVAMFEELKLEIAELKSYESANGQDLVMLADIGILFQQKIDKLKENER